MDRATRQQLSKGGAMAVKDAGGGISASGSAVSALLGADPLKYQVLHQFIGFIKCLLRLGFYLRL